MDYQGNSKKLKAGEPVPDKKIEKVIKGEVVVKKKNLGQKIKDTFVEADFRSVARYVVSDVLIPAARNMIVDASTKGIERMMYGDRAPHRRPGFGPPRMTYGGSPLRTDYRSPATRPPVQGARFPRAGQQDFVLESKDEAMNVLQSMHDILEMYEEVSVADFHELMGLPTSHVDQKWGWRNLVNSNVKPIREGWLIDLPPVEPI